jgi:hypothetical protein
MVESSDNLTDNSSASSENIVNKKQSKSLMDWERLAGDLTPEKPIYHP